MDHGKKIIFEGNKLNVPNNPIIPFIEGDGIGAPIPSPSINGMIGLFGTFNLFPSKIIFLP